MQVKHLKLKFTKVLENQEKLTTNKKLTESGMLVCKLFYMSHP